MIVEIYRDHTPVYKMSFMLQPGENIEVRQSENEPSWNTPGHIVKVYPDNNFEASITFFSLDFVQCRKDGPQQAAPAKNV